MKKIIAVLLCVAMLASVMVGCTSNKNVTETYNGITRSESTVKENGKETTTVVYTDENGNQLDEAIGEQAFQLAKDGDTEALEALLAGTDTAEADTAEADTASNVTEVPVEAEAAANNAAAVMAAASDNEEMYSGTLTIMNETGADMSELYFVFSTGMDEDVDDMDMDEWEDNMLENAGVLETGHGYQFNVNYTPSALFRIRFTTPDGLIGTFSDNELSDAKDPTDITITITDEGDHYHLEIE